MPQFDNEADDVEFLAGVEDFSGIQEEGATNILEMGSGQMHPSQRARTGGVPLNYIDPKSITTPRRKVAAQPKPWANKSDYSSIYARNRGSAMASIDFNQTPVEKDMNIEKKAGPIDQRVHEINEGPTGQGFVGKVKTPKRVSAQDEKEDAEMNGPEDLSRRSPASEGEGSEVQTFAAKMAKLQIIGKKDGAMLMSYAEFRAQGGSPESYLKYLQSRCYACAEQIEEGVMCHECFAAVNGPTPKKANKEVVIDILKKAAKNSEDMIVPKKKSTTKKFDWDTNRSAEPTDGHFSTKGTGEKEYLLHDADHYKEQTGEILNDPLVEAREKVTLTRGDEGGKKDSKKEKKADAQAAIDKEIKVDIEPAVLNKKQKGLMQKKLDPKQQETLQRKSLNQRPENFPSGRKSMTDERLIDYDGSKPQDYVTEFNMKGAERVKKDYPYQLMKPTGKEANIEFLPKGDAGKLPTSAPKGLPIARTGSGVPPITTGGNTLADHLGKKEPTPSPFRIGEKVVSAAFVGRGEVADLVYGDEGVTGAVIETKDGLVTVVIGAIKKADEQLTEDAKNDMQTMGLDPNNPDHVKQYLTKTKTARFKVAAKPNILEALHGKVGTKFSHKGRTAMKIEGVGTFYFRDEDLIPLEG